MTVTRIRVSRIGGIAAAALLSVAAAAALTPADKCESSKLKEAGKYGFCRLKAEAKAVKTGDPVDYSKCDDKYGTKWPSIESTGGGMCPSNGDQTAIQTFVTQHTDDLAVALDGGPLPDCPGDLATCGSDLGTCNTGLSTCSGDLSSCNTNLTAATASLTTCNADMGTCTGDLATCGGDLGTCNGDLATCSSDLAQSNADLATCSGDLATCTTALGTCPADLATCLAEPKGQRVRTGQTLCYDAAGTVIACAGTGQDGALLKGLTVSFTDNGDGTITDNRTGLMWEKLIDDGSIHDKDTTYTWTTAFTTKVATLNSTTFAGYTDWRLPNMNELLSLANYGAMNPSVHPPFSTGCVATCTVLTCSCTQPSGYWSSTTRELSPTGAWFVHFGEGSVSISGKTNGLYVRAVRGGS